MKVYDLFNVIQHPIAIYEYIDGKFIVYDFNEEAEKSENIKKEDIIGKDVVTIFPGIVEFGLLDVFKEVYKTGKTMQHPIRFYWDGRIAGWRRNTVYKLEDKIVAIYTDMKKEKYLEEQIEAHQNQFEEFFQKNKYVILEVHPQTQKIINCNYAAERFYGYSMAEITNMQITDINILSEEQIESRIRDAIAKKHNYFTFQHRLANGSIRDVEVYTSPIKVCTGETHLFSFINDITEKLEAQKASIENHRLSAIGEMASSVAHDFNNSLQNISGNIELFVHDHSTLTKKMKAELLRIHSSVNDVASRIQALLRFSAFKSKVSFDEDLYLERLSFSEVIDDIIFQSRPLWKGLAEHKGIRIHVIKNVPENYFIKGNQGLLTSALFNIVKNAIEAMPKGGQLRFSLTKEESEVVLRIRDTGIGMTDKIKLRIFQPFFSTKGFETGRGQGMSGAYQIIHNSKGTVAVEHSSPNVGTTIKISFPYFSELQINQEITPKSKHTKNMQNQNILWLDDDKDLNTIMKRYLDLFNLKGDVVLSAKEALKLLKEKSYDLVITDIGMPDMNGWDFIEIVRNTLKLQVDIVLISGWDFSNDQAMIQHYGIKKTLQKPISMKILKKLFFHEAE